MNEKNLHTQEFLLKDMRWKLLQKGLLKKQHECFKNLQHITNEKDIFSEPNRCIFQISLKYLKLVFRKMLFILVLCNFSFCFKIMWAPHEITSLTNNIPSTSKIKISDPTLSKDF